MYKKIDRAAIELADAYYKSTAPIIDSLKEIGRVASDFTNSLSSVISPQLQNLLSIEWDSIKKGIIETKDDIKIFKAAMVELNYPPHDGMDIVEMRKIAQSYVKDKEFVKENIDSMFQEIYDANEIKSILLGWEQVKLIERRIPILRNVIMVHP